MFSFLTNISDDYSGETDGKNESVSSVATLTDIHGEDIDAFVKECKLLQKKQVRAS